MGVWTTYCCVCGGCPGSITSISNLATWSDFLAFIKDVGPRTGVKKRLAFIEKNFKRLKESYNETNKGSRWLDKFGAILESGKFVPAIYGDGRRRGVIDGEYNESGEIEYGTYIVEVEFTNWDWCVKDQPFNKKCKRGALVHRECYNMLKNQATGNVFDIIEPLAQPSAGESKSRKVRKGEAKASGALKSIDYGIIENYQEQWFSWDRLIMDNNEWVIMDPRKNERNHERINKIIKQILSKSKPIVKEAVESRVRKPSPRRTRETRPSPSQSATKFPAGTRMRGNDGNLWEVRLNKAGVHRWVKISPPKN